MPPVWSTPIETITARRRLRRSKATSRTTLRTTKNQYRVGKSVPRIPPGIITKSRLLTMKLAYEVSMPITSTGTVIFTNINIGSVYDPTGTIGARQPYGTEVMFQLYKYATVLSAKLKLTCMAPYGDTAPITAMMMLQNTSAQSANIDELSDFYENPNRITAVKMFGNFITKNLDSNNSITGMYSAKKYYGKSSNIGTDPDYASIVTSNPTLSPHIGIYAITPYGSTVSSAAVSFVLQVSQIVKWWGPIDLDND